MGLRAGLDAITKKNFLVPDEDRTPSCNLVTILTELPMRANAIQHNRSELITETTIDKNIGFGK
jgi:hypothetical protein